jgi:hypothetical protein
MDRMRTDDDGGNEHGHTQELEEEGFPGFRPVDDQEEQLDNGDEQAGESPPDAFPEGDDQKPYPAEEGNRDSQDGDSGADSVIVSHVLRVLIGDGGVNGGLGSRPPRRRGAQGARMEKRLVTSSPTKQNPLKGQCFAVNEFGVSEFEGCNTLLIKR